MTSDFTKLPRLYTKQGLQSKAIVTLDPSQAHYLKNVLKRNVTDSLRLFNGQDGEFLAEIEQLDKKSAQVVLEETIREQPETETRRILLFAPLKKNRMDFLIEKTTELGVSDLYPVLTQRGEARKIRQDRIQAQIIEAAEQCERLSIPVLHELQDIKAVLSGWDQGVPLYAALERTDAPLPGKALKPGAAAFLTGPEGGFTPDEINFLKDRDFITPLSLGPQILRSETAALACLSAHALMQA